MEGGDLKTMSAVSVPADLAEYIAVLEKAGELRRVRAEVDWRWEAGAMSRLACERRGPAPLFENVKDYPGQQLAAVLLGPGKPLHARVALALGLDKTIPTLELMEEVRQRLKHPHKPVSVAADKAPCKEIKLFGKDAKLTKFPVPWIKEIDGGRYVGTWDLIVTKDPDTGWVNWGTYRCEMKGEDRFAVLLLPERQHAGMMFGKYERQGKPMPIAMVIGADPACHLGSIMPLDHGMSEVEAAGALRGQGVPLVRCETSDLEVPASAQIVIEAEVLPGERVEEGPFGEYTGHSAHRGTIPVARVTCITHRSNPIFTMANMGKPWDDYATPAHVMKGAVAKSRLEAHGIDVHSVYYHVPDIAVVAVKPSAGSKRRVVSTLLAGQRLIGSGIVLVEEDVDVTNVEDVFWAISSRMNPESYEVMRDMPINSLYAWVTPQQRKAREASAWVMDARFPHDWPEEYRKAHTIVSDFENGWSKSSKDNVLARWKEYGYGDI
jgi:phenyl-phosphate phosphatase/carboxylase subunit alpha